MKRRIKLTESDLHRFIKESVKKLLSEARKPSDRTIGKHTLKGLRYNNNGNPLYTSDTMSDDEKKSQGWKYSKKHGLYGQLSDPTKLSESDLHRVIKESVKKVLKENLNKENFVIVNAWNSRNYQTYNELYFDYADAIISSKYDGNVFLLRKEDAFSLSENMPNIEIYEIPNYLSSIDEMEEMLIDGEISLEDLKKIG